MVDFQQDTPETQRVPVNRPLVNAARSDKHEREELEHVPHERHELDHFRCDCVDVALLETERRDVACAGVEVVARIVTDLLAKDCKQRLHIAIGESQSSTSESFVRVTRQSVRQQNK